MMTDENNPDNERFAVGHRIVICRRGKKKIWVAEFSDNGAHRRKTLGTQNKKIAISRATQLAARLEAGEFAAAPPAITIEEAGRAYIAYQKTEGRARRTITRYSGELRVFEQFAADNSVRRMSQVAVSLLDAYRALRIKDHDPATVYHETVLLKQLFKWAKRRGMIVTNPIADYELNKPARKQKPVLTLAQVNRALKQCTPRRVAEISTLAFTGMRSGEVQGLRAGDVDLRDGWITVAEQIDGPTKTKHSRRVPIHPRLLPILRRQRPKPGQEFFFVSEPSRKYPLGGRPVNTKRLCEYFKAAALRVDIEGFVLHSLRHFFKSFCVNNGVPERAVDQWLGHSDGSVRGIYYHLSPGESKAFMDKVPFAEDPDDQSDSDEDSQDTTEGDAS